MALERDGAAQRRERGLRALVGRVAPRGHQRGERGDEHDRAAVLHGGQRRLRAQQVAAQVHAEDRVPALGRDLGERPAVADAGVEHQRIEHHAALGQRGEQRAHLGRVADVGGQGQMLRTGRLRLERGHRVSRGLEVAVGAHHARAALREPQADRAAVAHELGIAAGGLAATHHQHRAAGEISPCF